MSLPTIVTPRYSFELPSTGKQISFRPFLVKEEKILLMALESNDPLEAVRATKKAIENCCEGIDDVDTLPVFDIEFILLQLRAKSVGEVVEPTIKCPACGGNITLKIDLTKVKVQRTPGHNNKIPLTNTIGLIMKYPNYEMLQGAKVSEKPTAIETLSLMLKCIDFIYDDKQQYKVSEQSSEELQVFVDQLTQAHFVKIQEFFSTMPRVEHIVSYTCDDKAKKEGESKEPCGHKATLVLGNLQDFFA